MNKVLNFRLVHPTTSSYELVSRWTKHQDQARTVWFRPQTKRRRWIVWLHTSPKRAPAGTEECIFQGLPFFFVQRYETHGIAFFSLVSCISITNGGIFSCFVISHNNCQASAWLLLLHRCFQVFRGSFFVFTSGLPAEGHSVSTGGLCGVEEYESEFCLIVFTLYCVFTFL